MKKTIEIYGVTFELMSRKVDYNIHTFKTLGECYNRPSIIKQDIYDYWVKWFNGIDSLPCENGIISYNCNFFTYGGYFRYGDKMYYAYITHTHNRLYIAE